MTFGEKDSTFATWTSTTVVYSLIAALAAQILLLVLTRRLPSDPASSR